MGRKEKYKLDNEQFLDEVSREEGVKELDAGVHYRVINEGNGKGGVKQNSVVTVHYKGTLVNGREFDNSWKRGCPEAFRVSGLIEGFAMALQRMSIGDRWVVYIPSELGYGKRANGSIPGCSTLIFDIELMGIA